MPRKTSPTNLQQLPVNWHVAMRKLNTWIAPKGEFAARPSILLITLLEEQTILSQEVLIDLPQAQEVLDILVNTMKKPNKSAHLKAHRPKQINFELEEMAQMLGPDLKAMGVATACQPASQEINAVFSSLENMMLDQGVEDDEKLPGILTEPDNTPELVGRVWAAAADYYRAAPWMYLDDSQPLALDFSPILEPGSLNQGIEKNGFVQLMGYGGLEFGIVFYWKWEDVLSFYEMMKRDPKQGLPAEGWNTFTFGDAATVPSADLDAIEKYGWDIAGPEAYPLPVIYFGNRLERPNAEMLAYFEAALRAIPQFVNRLQPDDSNDYLALKIPINVETALGTRIVTVRYPAGELPASIFLDDGEEIGRDFLEDDIFGDEEKLPDFYLEDEEEDEKDIILDQRAFEADLAALSQTLEEFGGERSNLAPELEKAQKIIYRAWEERQPARRVQLARKALDVSLDCADAYVLLAEEEAETPEDACELYEKGMHAGMRALGEKYFTKEYKGMFWGLLETRGYMRARAGLAECLEYLDRSDESITHYEALLQLNPNDNQGIRYQFMGLLLRQNMNIRAGKLLEDYKEDASAVWTYSRALLAFRQLGPSILADAALRQALRSNPHVSPYLIGSKPLPEELPEMIGFSDEDEAIDYAANHFGNWWGTPGAVIWLKEISKSAQSEKTAKSKTKKKRRHS